MRFLAKLLGRKTPEVNRVVNGVSDAGNRALTIQVEPEYFCYKCGRPMGREVPGIDPRFLACPSCRSAEDCRLVDNGDGTLTDFRSGLTWQIVDDGIRRNQQQAFAYCENLSLGGFADWELPRLAEFRVLDEAATSSRLEMSTITSPSGEVYWTATDAPPGFPHEVAYTSDSTTFYRTNEYCVRCVRRRRALLQKSRAFLKERALLGSHVRHGDMATRLELQKAIRDLESQSVRQWYDRHGQDFGPMSPFNTNSSGLYESPPEALDILFAGWDDDFFFKWRAASGAIVFEVWRRSTDMLNRRHIVLKDRNGDFFQYMAWLS